MRDAHVKTKEEILHDLDVDPEKGLTEEQVQRNREKYGVNELPEEEGTPFWKLVIKQFEDLLVRILLAAAVISFGLALFEEGEDRITAFVEPLVIMLILIANAIVGVWQENNAEHAIEALKKYEATHAMVKRKGEWHEKDAKEIVYGDYVQIRVGMSVPADIRIVTLLSATMRADQSLLTGETESVSKTVEPIPQPDCVIQEKKNIVFSGTMITHGVAEGIVVGVGKDSQLGIIHGKLKQTEEEQTPLKKKLDEFGELLSKVILVICIIVWVINIGNFTDPVHGGLIKGAVYYFKIAVALAVAAIPEGLPAVVTTCLALGTRKMAKKNAIVRSLPSVETLGCTTVICSDKTGTLTTNKMNVQKVVIPSESGYEDFKISGFDYSPVGTISNISTEQVLSDPYRHDNIAKISIISTMCNESIIEYDEEKDVYVKGTGEPTEAALRVLVEKIGGDEDCSSSSPEVRAMFYNHQIQSKFELKRILEFTRDRKSMSVLCSPKDARKSKRGNNEVLFVKGAPESIIARCNRILVNGKVVNFTKDKKDFFLESVNSTGRLETLRCLGMAYKDDVTDAMLKRLEDVDDPAEYHLIENDMVFVGYVGMLDPPREEVKESIRMCREAGIRVVVITGDNKATAEEICRRIDVFTKDEDLDGKSFTGREFDALSPEQKIEAVKSASLFSRTEPEHKLKIVQLLQEECGDIAAMTGDGVNDATALRKAAIGVAMGSGTDVAKGASDMVLADDNFSTIVSAVEEGRAIYNNTKQFIRYLISSNIGEVVSIFLTAALGMPEALVPVQLLWVNLVTDGLPATALGFNPPDKRIMKDPPRNPREPIVNGWLFIRYLIIGVYVGVATVAGYAWWQMYYDDGPLVTWTELTTFHSCPSWSVPPPGGCAVFSDTRPATVSLSILVTIEMFNALNAVSENESIFIMTPFANMWLIYAILLSFVLHFMILYIPFLATVFGVFPLTSAEWTAVLALSAPVILIDEVLKFLTRNYFQKHIAYTRKKDV